MSLGMCRHILQQCAAPALGMSRCRVEVGNVVSASNLFKYCAPAHGLLLFKQHDPLAFTATDVQQLLLTGSRWFDAAAAAAVASGLDGPVISSRKGNDAALSADSTSATASSERILQRTQQASRRLWPLLLWNNLPRAGASQFHGHAQTALSEVRKALLQPTEVWKGTQHMMIQGDTQ
jgi:hypothetical protein